MKNSHLGCIIFTSLLALTASGQAAASEASIIDLRIHEQDGDRPSFVAGAPLYLNAAVNVPPRLQVRIFCGTKDYLSTSPHTPSADGRCWIYDSSLWPYITIDRQLRLVGNIPIRFLGVDYQKKQVKAQTYFLVFEDGNLPSGKIQIRTDKVGIYFRRGQEIEIKPPPGVTMAQVIEDKKNNPNNAPGIGCVEEVTHLGDDSVRFASTSNCGDHVRHLEIGLPWRHLLDLVLGLW